jgi:tetratricopeptide (TPR) repeat protein
MAGKCEYHVSNRLGSPLIHGGRLVGILVAGTLLGISRPSLSWSSPLPQGSPAGTSKAAPETAEWHVGKGLEAMKNSRFQEAIREFRSALALDPSLVARAQFPLAVALFGVQDLAQARQELESIRAKTGDDPNLAYYLGRIDFMEGRIDASIGNLTLAANAPPFPDTAYYLGYAYFRKHDTARAEEWLKKAARLAPQDFRVQERLALLYKAMGRNEESAKAFALSDELHRGDVAATAAALDCGRALDTRPLEEARPLCQKLYDAQNVSKLVTLGTIYGNHRDYLDALEPFRRAAELEPDSYELQYNLGLTYFRLKRYAEAHAPLEAAARLRPDMFQTTAPLGAVLYALGDDAEAERVLRRAHAINPESPDVSRLLFQVRVNLYQKSLQKKDYQGALSQLLGAAELRPGDPEVHLRLAEVYTALGENSKAAEELQKAKDLSENR